MAQQYADAQHPPNADHRGEEPTTPIDIGPAGISVTLDAWGPEFDLFTTLYDTTTATWGDEPTRSGDQPCPHGDHGPYSHYESWEHITSWCKLTEPQRAFLDNAFKGGTLQQDLEGINFWFTIDGVSRAFTHEFVRTRLGAAFKQHGGRDNDWRHRRWTMTESIDRMCTACETDESNDGYPHGAEVLYTLGKRHCITDWKPIDHLLSHDPPDRTIRQTIADYLEDGKRLYAAMVDAGIPWQDARRVLPIGTQTYVHGIYNYVGFRGAAANRLEFIMDWEINCVFQLMLREVRMKCPPIMSKYLGSHSDLNGRAMFDRLQLCPPDGKYPSTTIRCATCGHHEGNHVAYEPTSGPTIDGEMVCEVCERVGGDISPLHKFMPEDMLPRVFRREQQPFFVLHPDSMAGGPVQWLWTNGHYKDIEKQLTVNGV